MSIPLDTADDRGLCRFRILPRSLDALAAWAPGLHEALTGPGEGDHVIVDGTLIPTDRTPCCRHRGQPEHYQQFNRDHA